MALDGAETSIDALAAEILHLICDHLDVSDLMSLRLTNKTLGEMGASHILHRVTVEFEPESFNKISKILRHQAVPSHVSTLRLNRSCTIPDLADRAFFNELGLFPTIDGTKIQQDIKRRNPTMHRDCLANTNRELYQNAIKELTVDLRKYPAETWAIWYSRVASVVSNRPDIIPANSLVD
ncbi:hypothetical protein BU16DRAFT_566210 [Lophium mytilinum]|uniref:F-box domain-containing protein n=1 Tax=Lophium mytilinum TaxID=390894 RepID=A0A6A6QEZ1_9PEZI|nr:hypothetical protein BU16DRAFT_566210 [Lophium mytilinum]